MAAKKVAYVGGGQMFDGWHLIVEEALKIEASARAQVYAAFMARSASLVFYFVNEAAASSFASWVKMFYPHLSVLGSMLFVEVTDGYTNP